VDAVRQAHGDGAGLGVDRGEIRGVGARRRGIGLEEGELVRAAGHSENGSQCVAAAAGFV
jgi:hypothetical protein